MTHHWIKSAIALMGLVIITTALSGQPAREVERVDTLGLIVLYPQYQSVELVCGNRPSQFDASVLLMAEAAYTRVKPLRKKFSHNNIHRCQRLV